MNQTPQAKKIWKAIPKNVRLKILNNVWCVHCSKMTGVGNTTMNIDRGDLIIRGHCTLCGGDVARLVEGEGISVNSTSRTTNQCTYKTKNINPDISKLVQFRSGTKAARVVESVKNLKIKSFGEWNFKDHFPDADDTDGPISSPYDSIFEAGPRPSWEMQNVLPGYDPKDFNCPIGVGIEILNSGDWYGAIRHMKNLLKQDDRCLDAYAHIGNWYLEYGDSNDLNVAKNYYKIGSAIALKSIGKKSNDIFPWSLIDNRPFFRCLHGLGLCFYRQKKPIEALTIFSKMIWMNPVDNQGVRFLIDDLSNGLTWEESVRKQEFH